MLNDGLRHDDLTPSAIQLVRSLRHSFACASTALPETVYRGGGLPEQHRSFYDDRGRRFRSPMLLAASDRIEVARRFARSQPHEMVVWRIRLPRNGHVGHISYISPQNVGVGSGGGGKLTADADAGYFFAPYAAFEVGVAKWSLRPSEEPHLIELIAIADGRCDEDDELPLAGWS